MINLVVRVSLRFVIAAFRHREQGDAKQYSSWEGDRHGPAGLAMTRLFVAIAST
jgi:hypothetical protein